MEKIKNYIKRPHSIAEKIIFLLILYLILRDVFVNIPYINLLTKDIGNRTALTWLVALLLFHPSTSKLLITSMIFFILYLIITFLGGQSNDYGIGLIIFTNLVFAAFKYPRK